MKDKLIKLIQDFAPVLAGFQITVTLVGSIGLGAIANWILVHWVPFTHYVWTEFLQYLSLPDISDKEKDALTAVTFFIPMAISTFWAREDKNPRNIHNIKLYAGIVGMVFFAIIGQEVLEDIITRSPETADALSSPVWRKAVVFTTLLLFMLSAIFGAKDSRTNPSQQKHVKEEQRLKALKRTDIEPSTYIEYALKTAIITIFCATMLLAVPSIGLIRSIAPILILVCLYVSILKTPNRLLATFGVVLAFLLTSVVYDGIAYFIQFVENASST